MGVYPTTSDSTSQCSSQALVHTRWGLGSQENRGRFADQGLILSSCKSPFSLAIIKELIFFLSFQTDEEGLEPVKPSIPVAVSDGVLAVIAGSDTVAAALTALWHFLLREPSAFERLRIEVESYFPHGDEPLDFSKMANMPYLNGCM